MKNYKLIYKDQTLLFIISNLLFVLCGTLLALTATTQQIGYIMNAVGGVKSLAVSWIFAAALFTLAGLIVVAFKFRFVENTYKRLRENSVIVQLLFIIFAMLCAGCFVGKFYDNAYIHAQHLRNFPRWWYHLPYVYGKVAEPLPYTPPQWIFSSVMFFPVALFYTYFLMAFVDIIKGIITTLTKSEKRFLIIGSVIAVMYIVVLYNLSNVFYTPIFKYTTEVININAFYQYDNGSRLTRNVFIDPIALRGETLRHPLFGIFALPIGFLARIISTKYLYHAVALQSMQMILLIFVAIMLSRLIVTVNKNKTFFLMFLFLSFPMLVGSLPIERNILTFVFLIFGIYTSLTGVSGVIWATGAVGSNLIYAPVFLTLIKSKKTVFKDMIIGGNSFLLLLMLTGRISFFIDYKAQLTDSLRYIGEQFSWYSRICYYLAFVQSCVFTPKSTVIISGQKASLIISASILESISFIGVFILILTILGFVLNFKNRFAQISFGWVVLSFLLMCVGAWAIGQKDTVFYTLFFSWAYISLIYLAIDKLFRNKVKTVILVLLVAACFTVNGKAVIDILRFGTEYYPLVGTY